MVCRYWRALILWKFRQDVYEAHPDWIAVDAEGKKRRHWAMPELWVTCALGPYNFDFMTAVTREITEKYKPEGIFSNRWAGSGMCYCELCRGNFKSFSGLELPRTLDPANAARRQYIFWHQKRLFDLWTVWNDAVELRNPGRCIYRPNSGGGALLNSMQMSLGAREPFLAADRQARRGLMPIWSNGKNGKEYRSTMDEKPIAGLVQCGPRRARTLEGFDPELERDPFVEWWTALRRACVRGSLSSMRAPSISDGCRINEEIYCWRYAD